MIQSLWNQALGTARGLAGISAAEPENGVQTPPAEPTTPAQVDTPAEQPIQPAVDVKPEKPKKTTKPKSPKPSKAFTVLAETTENYKRQQMTVEERFDMMKKAREGMW